MLLTYFSFSQNQSDTILVEKKIQEVMISATKTSRTINQLPIPVVIISEKEIKEFSASKLYDVVTTQTGIVSVPTRTELSLRVPLIVTNSSITKLFFLDFKFSSTTVSGPPAPQKKQDRIGPFERIK